MTVIKTNASNGPYTGNGATTVFPFDFSIANEAEVEVYIDGVVQTSGFEVTVNAGGNGGSIIFDVAPAAGQIYISSKPSFTQGTSFENAGAFLASTHDAALDKLTRQNIYILALLSRAILAPIGEEMGVIADAAERFGKFLTFDADGNPIMADGTGADGVLRADLAANGGAALVAFLQSGAGAAQRSIQSKLRDTVSVKDFGAVGDGVTNDHAAFVAAVAAARGKRLTVPEGNYLIDTNGGSITLEEVELVGEGVLDGATGSIDQGTMLHITGTVNSPFKVRRGTVIAGLGFYYPNQADNAAPTAYPVTIDFDFTNGAVQFVEIKRNVVYNAYKFIDINDAAGNVGHVEISGNYICALNRGIYVRHNAEHLRIKHNNFTFGHWLAATELGTRSYMRANATAIEVAQSDGIEIVDNLFYGHLNGVLMAGTGLCQFMTILTNKFDAVRFPLKATGAGNLTGTISANNFIAFNPQSTALQGRSISIDTTGVNRETLAITGNNFLLATEEHIYVSGDTATRDIVITGNNYLSWGAYKAAGSYGAVNVNGASTNVQVNGGWALASNPPYNKGVVGSLNTLQVTGVTFEQCYEALNIVTNSATITGNRSYVTGGALSDVINAVEVRSSNNTWDKPSGTGKHAFVARDSTAQTFNSGVAADVVFGSELVDTDGTFASPTFTAKTPGLYQFNWMLTHDNTGTAGDRWNLALVVNGAVIHDPTYRMPAAEYGSVPGSYLVKLATGDTVKLQVRRLGGAGQFKTLAGAFSANSFSGVLVN